MLALVNADVLIDGRFAQGMAVLIEGDRIAAVLPQVDVPADADRLDLDGAMLVPGFVDIQVNGGGDALFNDAPTVDTIRRIGEAHAQYGTTGFLPTLISDDLEVIREGIAAVDAAIAAGVPGVLGIHVEGPFINAARKGIHAAEKIRPIDEADLAVLTSLQHGRTLVTLAPEVVGEDVVRHLVASGVIVSAGHTAASYEQIVGAVRAGVTGVTHLFNAMSPLGNREPGAVGAALSCDHVWCGLIVDGLHVSPVTLRLALRCKPMNRFMLVSDAMPTTGGRSRSFLLNGRVIRAIDGRLVDEDGTLAGADLHMLDAVINTHRMLAVSIPDALGMASTNPADFLRLSDTIGRIEHGRLASLLAIDDNWCIQRRWIAGAER